MKFLKWFLIVVLFLAALVLIIPLFLPSTIEVSTSKQVAVLPYQVFHNAAMYTDRDAWDPWLETDPEAEVTIDSKPDYIGSTYSWNGEKIKNGKMQVDSVVFGKYIASSIWFGDNPEASLVEWILEPIEFGTSITWNFSAEGAYPIERLMINLMKGGMLKSFDKGMENLSKYLEMHPPRLASLGEITEGELPGMVTLVSPAKGTMEEMGDIMGDLYGKIIAQIGTQGLEMAGAPFTHYLSFDQATGIAEFLAGIPVASAGKDTDDVMVKKYRKMKVVQAIHQGPYEEFRFSYEKLMRHVQENELDVAFEAFEIYYTDPMSEPDVRKWQTMIAFPLD